MEFHRRVLGGLVALALFGDSVNQYSNEAKENIYSIFYPTVARRVVESVVTLPFDASKNEHTLTLSPNDPAIVFEKIVVDAGGYQPEFLFGEESEKKRD